MHKPYYVFYMDTLVNSALPTILVVFDKKDLRGHFKSKALTGLFLTAELIGMHVLQCSPSIKNGLLA